MGEEEQRRRRRREGEGRSRLTSPIPPSWCSFFTEEVWREEREVRCSAWRLVGWRGLPMATQALYGPLESTMEERL